MEFLTIFLSSLLSIAAPPGIIIDTIVASKFREQFEQVEQLEVRIDNVPNYRLIQGYLQKVRLASRGVFLTSDFRVDTFELETDPIQLDLATLQQGGRNSFNRSLQQPLQGAFRVVITETDLNNLLRSPQIVEKLPELINKARGENGEPPSYELLNPEIDFLDNNRMRVKVEFQRLGVNESEPLKIMLEMGLISDNGKNIKIVELFGTLNDRQLSQRLLNGFAEGITDRLDLGKLDERGLMTRLLLLQIDNNRINLAGFARLERENE